MPIISFIKKNWLIIILIAVIAFLLLRTTRPIYKTPSRPLSLPASGGSNADMVEEISYKSASIADSVGSIGMPNILPGSPPAPDVDDRMVVQNSHLSLKVSNVEENLQNISQEAEKQGGYMVDANISKPQDSVSGNITVRVPAEKLDDFLSYCRGLAVKVVSENLKGRDITDQFVDTQAKIDTLEKTKSKFEEILNKANKVPDILQVQRELTNIQDQIDRLKGQNKYLEQTAKMSKVTIYLASDELDLPYAPSEAWRPNVIFKTAVRSLISTARKLGSLLIWLGVYSIVWLPILIIILIIRKKHKKQNPPTPNRLSN